jgi:hypothetical protein
MKRASRHGAPMCRDEQALDRSLLAFLPTFVG